MERYPGLIPDPEAEKNAKWAREQVEAKRAAELAEDREALIRKVSHEKGSDEVSEAEITQAREEALRIAERPLIQDEGPVYPGGPNPEQMRSRERKIEGALSAAEVLYDKAFMGSLRGVKWGWNKTKRGAQHTMSALQKMTFHYYPKSLKWLANKVPGFGWLKPYKGPEKEDKKDKKKKDDKKKDKKE